MCRIRRGFNFCLKVAFFANAVTKVFKKSGSFLPIKLSKNIFTAKLNVKSDGQKISQA